MKILSPWMLLQIIFLRNKQSCNGEWSVVKLLENYWRNGDNSIVKLRPSETLISSPTSLPWPQVVGNQHEVGFIRWQPEILLSKEGHGYVAWLPYPIWIRLRPSWERITWRLWGERASGNCSMHTLSNFKVPRGPVSSYIKQLALLNERIIGPGKKGLCLSYSY